MASITINNKEYPMALTTRAIKKIGEKFGGLENLGETLYQEKAIDKQLDVLLELVTLLVNEAAARHNLFETTEDKWPTITAEFIEVATTPTELSGFAEAIRQTLQEGMKRTIESETDTKN